MFRWPIRISLQWMAMAVFWLSFAINFLDRQLLAASAPAIKAEYGLSNAEYGQLISGFYLVYAISTPFAGLLIDRIGLKAGTALAVGFWSIASAATALTRSFWALLGCRMGLGLGEAAGFPSLAKATVTYLKPAEMGLAAGFGAISISLGSMAAPLVVAALAPGWGWRSVFVLSGLLGLLWIPLWLFTARQVPAQRQSSENVPGSSWHILRDRRMWAIATAYCLVFALYTLWSNWTTIYLVEGRGLTQVEANARYAWFPPAFAVIGGFFAGGLTFYWIRRGMDGFRARVLACWVTAPFLLAGVAIPFLPTTTLAATAIGVSFFAFQSMLNSIFLMPLDLFGRHPAGFAGSVLGFIAASGQVVLSPAIGAVLDRVGFDVLCVGVSLLPLAGLMILQLAIRTRAVPSARPAQ